MTSWGGEGDEGMKGEGRGRGERADEGMRGGKRGEGRMRGWGKGR
jgi:hypothetical protein